MKSIENNISRMENLDSPYKELAMLRRSQQKISDSALLGAAFEWGNTPEGNSFWYSVQSNEKPPIPNQSLIEIGEIKESELPEYQQGAKDAYKWVGVVGLIALVVGFLIGLIF